MVLFWSNGSKNTFRCSKVSNNHPVCSDLKPFRAFWDDVRVKAIPELKSEQLIANNIAFTAPGNYHQLAHLTYISTVSCKSVTKIKHDIEHMSTVGSIYISTALV